MRVLLVLILLAAFTGTGSAGDKDWSPDLMMKVKRIDAVRVSPDGKRVTYTVIDAVMTPDKSEFVTQIHIANADGSDPIQVTFAEKSSSNPQWSPDGKWLAFTSMRTGKNNLYLLRVSGGEAEQLTSVKTGVGYFAWSPDGKSIAFTMLDQPSEDDEKATKGKDDSRWMDENIKVNRLYVMPVTRGSDGRREMRLLTAGAYNLGTGISNYPSFDWSPDGKSIAFFHTKSPKADYWTSADVSAVDVATGEVKAVANTQAAEIQPIYSPDGKWIAMAASDSPPQWGFNFAIQILPAGGGAPRQLAGSFDRSPGLIGWSGDGKRIYFTEARGTTSRIYAIDIETNAISEINRGNEVCATVDINQSGTMLGFVMQFWDRPAEAFISRADRFEPVQISRVNEDIPKLPLGRTEVIRWKSADGMEIEGLLTYPVNYQAGKRVPLLLQIHGGPAGVFTQTFIANMGLYPIATFAARGYAVLRANPRGSSGYGKDFRFANYKDWGGEDYKDLMTGVDHVIKMGVADPDRLGVMGWSYGGFMTSWVITQTKRFKAASIGAPVTNLMSFTGTADIPSFIPGYFGAQPWEALDIYRAHSPMSHVKGVTTPAIIQHGDADDRVPISQGYEFYNALKSQGVTTRMIVLPRQPHGPNEPKMLLKVMQTNLEWFEKYLQ
jgi:dipeptidyl aminopeptidase/acylaminoacyl peptidase